MPRGQTGSSMGRQRAVARAGDFADMDNLIKPIQDALQGTAYLDDSIVVDVTGSWRDINSWLPVRFMSPALATAFSDGREFVHIRLWVTPSQQELG